MFNQALAWLSLRNEWCLNEGGEWCARMLGWLHARSVGQL